MKIENCVRMREALYISKLERLPGEVKVLECRWSTVESLLYDYRRMYAGIGEEIGPEEEAGRLAHQHRVPDRDGEEFWEECWPTCIWGGCPNLKMKQKG